MKASVAKHGDKVEKEEKGNKSNKKKMEERKNG
jgi:hypothetical protein